MDFVKVERCRSCGSGNLTDILSLGEQYMVNFVEDPNEKANSGPLDLVLCDAAKGGCGLLQLKHTFSRDLLYRKYWYRSGISSMMRVALADIVNKAEKLVELKKGDIVIDIGSNDGTLLKSYKPEVTKVGFEPSNLWEAGATDPNTTVIHDYFSHSAFAKNFPGKRAKVITAIAMFYDLDDPNGFVEDIKKCLDKDGVWIIQMNYLGLMLENNTFDNISHEHLEYYSFLSLNRLLARHDMEAFDVELNDVNGGSFRIYVRNNNSKTKVFDGAEKRVAELKESETRLGLDSANSYLKFAERIKKIKTELTSLLKKEVAGGKKIFIYGASTRGLVVLQFCGIDNKLIAAATDMNKDKWGKYIVGTGIPIIPIDEYRRSRPDYLFILPYHFLKELVQQEKQYLVDGGRFIVAIPSVRVIDKSKI
ncbi:MAG: class I SAM-dependent methyltransferase [Candidatus Micrarchaeota archaeon]|nr:class I SAM-dependent methyltransferase [Candidatus Micrarchaeota archaeon]